ncbi:methylase [Spirochaetia bacterium]|nr:methylase [Spirochaetia bacterium]GHU29305.1 methylase [Spirochaetia bacterium]
MPLSFNEIRTRAASFVNDWKGSQTVREKAEAQTFEAGFLNVFGVDRRKVALFEHEVHFGTDEGDLFDGASGGGGRGYIDLLWKGHIIIEMKTPGKDLNKAFEQAKAYTLTLPQKEMPKAILTSDFLNFQYYDLEDNAKLYQFTLEELPDHIELFSFLAGYKDVVYKPIDPVNIEAAERMGRLHDRLRDIGYSGHQLEMYLVRLLFCLFADDTGIFDQHKIFLKYIIERTNPDGSDLALHLHKIFETLNRPADKRLKIIDEQLNRFQYIDGGIFDEQLATADFDAKMRDTLIECCKLDWSKISPAIFGAMFQSVMNKEARHEIGAHYTSEENILKVIHPLFLDALWEEFAKIKRYTSELRTEQLATFHEKIATLTFLDPACGCGNFLVISYRELRLLEMEVIKELLAGTKLLDVDQYIKVNVNQFYGIEIEEFPARIAQTALWLTDHQMNMHVREHFGQYFIRIPLTASATIINGNALTINWENIIQPAQLSYILGNPPFLGYSVMNKDQKKEVEQVFAGKRDSGVLDYVTCWYKKAAEYIQGTSIEVAFVSTNSICQGDQVPILWPELLNKHGIKVNFAHQTFKWTNEAKGNAQVFCIIIGFSLNDRTEKKLYLYETVKSRPVESAVKRINAYLVDAPTIFIERRANPLCPVSPMLLGNLPRDDGNFFLDQAEKDALIAQDPVLAEVILPFLGAREFLHNIPRYCLWLKGISPAKYTKSKVIMERIAQVRLFREKSTREATRTLADFPTLFAEIRQPDTDYLLIPRVSSETRKYIPIGFIPKDVICGDANSIIPNATFYEFGVITSTMHMAWMRAVCGRLKSDYRYSGVIVYNNFPWPQELTGKQKAAIESAAQEVLNARMIFPDITLADLYDNDTMLPELKRAHQKLDKAVEVAYNRTFANDAERVAYLFELYQKLAGEMFIDIKKRGKGRKIATTEKAEIHER